MEVLRLMECACPWCLKPAEPGCFSPIAGDPTCFDHAGEGLVEGLLQALLQRVEEDLVETPCAPKGG